MFKKICLLSLVLAFAIPLVAANISPSGRRGDPDDWFILVRNGDASVAITHGTPMIWDTAETDGVDVTSTSSTDDELIAGIVPDDSSSVGRLNEAVNENAFFWLQIRGFNEDAIVNVADDVTVGQSVGTTNVSGEIGDGDGLGVCVEARSGVRAGIFVNPDN